MKFDRVNSLGSHGLNPHLTSPIDTNKDNLTINYGLAELVKNMFHRNPFDGYENFKLYL